MRVRHDTKKTNMAMKLPPVVYTKSYRMERIKTLITLKVLDGVWFLPTPFVDEHVPTRQANAPEYAIRDIRRWVEL